MLTQQQQQQQQHTFVSGFLDDLFFEIDRKEVKLKVQYSCPDPVFCLLGLLYSSCNLPGAQLGSRRATTAATTCGRTQMKSAVVVAVVADPTFV